MKSWLGVIGRACLEFFLIVVLISFVAGASNSLSATSGGFSILTSSAARAALDLVPLAVILTLFLAFFSFELRVKSRAAGWFGLVVLGAVLASGGIGLRRLPPVRDFLQASSASANAEAKLIEPGTAVQSGRVALWIGSYDGAEAVDAVAADFGSDYPRLAYAQRAPLDRVSGLVELQGKGYSAVVQPPRAFSLAPEAAFFSGSWIWERIAALDRDSLYLALGAAGGFLLLAVGFRFLCRITGWPLANALVGATGLAGLAILDAWLAGGSVSGQLSSFLTGLGLRLPLPLQIGCVEGALGLLLGAADLATTATKRRRRDE
jgi:hypothetical protein